MYRFAGVPKAFQTREQALTFLLNSPGYVKRRQKYLSTYWPGLLADVKGKTTPGRAGLAMAGEQQALRQRSKKLRGVEEPSLLDSIGSAAKKLAEERVGQRAARATPGLIRATPGAVKANVNWMADLARSDPKTQEATLDFALGKGLTNLAQGQGPKNWMDVLGLGAGVLGAGVPVFRGPAAGGAALRAAWRGEQVGEAAAAAYRTSGPVKSTVRVVRGLKGSDEALRGASVVAENITAPGKARPTKWKADDPRRIDFVNKKLWSQRPKAEPSPFDGERAGLVNALKQSHGSRKNGLPARMRGAQAMGVIRLIDHLASVGERGRFWYAKSAKAMLDLTGGDKLAARKLAALVAIYSPQQAVVQNIALAKGAMDEFVKTGAITVGDTHKIAKAMNVMENGDTAWEGRKTANFYRNILKYLDPEHFAAEGFAGDEVTADMWMARLFGYRTDNVSDGRYDVIESVVRQIAKEKGWSPDEVQAATWVAMKNADPWDVSPNVDFAGAIDRNTFTVNLETTKGISGIGDDLTFPETAALNEALAPTVASIAERLGMTVRARATVAPAGAEAVRPGRSAYEAGRNASLHMDVFERPENVERLTNVLARAFDQYEVWATKPGSVYSKARPGLHFTAPELDNPEVADAFFAALNARYPKKMVGFTPYRDGGGITVISNGSLTNPKLTGWANEFADGIVEAADTAGIPHVDFEAQNIGVIVGEGVSGGDSAVPGGAAGRGGSGRTLDDQLASEGRTALEREVERIRAARGAPAAAPARRSVTVPVAAPPGRELGASAFSDINVPLRPPARERTLRLNELEQDFPTARSRFSRVALEDNADRISRVLSGETKMAAVGRRLLPTATVEARVAKGAGRAQMITSERHIGAVAKHLKALPDEGSPDDIAHFWWAQLSSPLRNADGLRLVRGKMGERLDDLVNGKVLDDLTSQNNAVKAKMGEAYRDGDQQALFDLMKERDLLKIRISDIPVQIDDLKLSLARLDEVVANPPKLDPKVIQAVHALSGDREAVLVGAGVLDSGRAAERKGLVSGWVGAKQTGEEAFIGHRAGKVKGSRPSGLAGGVGTGRVSLPEGVAKKNTLERATSGRVRESTHVAAEDWQAAQVYRSATRSRDDLARMGTSFDGKLAEDDLLVNPKGRAVPAHWKKDKLEELAANGFDETEVRQAADDIVKTFLAEPGELDEMLAAAKEAGVQWHELRVVKRATAERYFGQFVKAQRATKGGRVYDHAVDTMVASLIFARIGYIPKNVVQNLIMAVPHQGIFQFANIPRALQALRDPDLRHLLAAEVGQSGATIGGVGKEFTSKALGVPHKAAALAGGVADTPLRISAFLHEAAAEGIIPKLNPVLGPEDKQALLELLQNPQSERLLNNVRSRAVEAMADFSRLTPQQRRWARRFVIIPGWLWAGTRYPIHFAATHPGRAGAIGYVAAGQPGREGGPLDNRPITDYMAEGVPEWAAGLETPWGVERTNSLSPVQTPWDVGKAALMRDGKAAGDFVNPLAASVYNVAKSQVDSPTGTYKTDFLTSLQKNAERIAPNVGLVRDMISPNEDSTYYPEDASRLGRLKREVGILPIELNRGVGQGGKPPATRAEERVTTELGAMKKIMPVGPKTTAAYGMRQRVLEARYQVTREFPDAKGADYQRRAYVAEIKAIYGARVNPVAVQWAQSASGRKLEAARREEADKAYGDAIRHAKDIAREKGWVWDEITDTYVKADQ